MMIYIILFHTSQTNRSIFKILLRRFLSLSLFLFFETNMILSVAAVAPQISHTTALKRKQKILNILTDAAKNC